MKKTTSLDYFKDKWISIEYAKKGNKQKGNKQKGKIVNDDNDPSTNKNNLLTGKCLI